MMVTVFEHKKEVTKPKYFHVDSVLEQIKSCKLMPELEKLLAIPDLAVRKDRKGYLPNICFSGKFSVRTDDGMMEHSGLAILDIDHIGTPEQVSQRKEEIKKLNYVYSCFVSPSRDGLKVLVKIPPKKETHRAHYAALMKLFPQIDATSINESRVCFASADADIYINKEAVEFTDTADVLETRKIEYPVLENKGTNYHLIARAAKMIQESANGEKHAKLLKAAKLLGGYVATGAVDETDAIYSLESEISKKDIDDLAGAKKTIRDGINYGKANPIFETEEFKIYKSERKREEETNDADIKYFTRLEDVKTKFDNLYDVGITRGVYLGYNTLHEHITIKPEGTTYIYGSPWSGKSEWWFDILINLSEFYEWNHVIYSPESGDASEIFAELVSKYIRSQFYKNPFNQRMDESEKKRGEAFVNKHFIIIDPKDHDMTIDEFFKQVNKIEEYYGIKINTTCCDPFNELKHTFTERQDLYIENRLGFIRRDAFAHHRHNVIITHCTDQLPSKTSDGVTYYPPPTAREIAGGQAWYRKAMNLICLWRPPAGLIDEKTGTPYLDNEVHIFIHKFKPKGTGKRGVVKLYYDMDKNRYYESSPEGRRYAAKESYTATPISSNPNLYIEPTKADEPDNAPF